MHSTLSLRSILAIIALAAFTVWITWRAKAIEMGSSLQGESSPLMGKQAPEFALESLDGQKMSLASYRGKTVVATFWASWCGPCRMEIPVLTKFYRDTHKPDSNFEIVAISVDSVKEDAEAAAKSLKMPFPVLLDPGSRTATAYHVEGIPTLFVIDKGGKIFYSHLGFTMGLDLMLAQQLQITNYSPTGGK